MRFKNKFVSIWFCFIAFLHSSAHSAATADGLVPSTAPEYILFKEAHQYQLNGNLQEAGATYVKASEYDPSDCSPYIHLNLGIIYTSKGDTVLAIEEYKKALKFDSKMPEALLNLGSAYQAVGNLTAAQNCFRDYLALPDAPQRAVVERLLDAVSRADRYMPARQASGEDYVANVVSNGITIWAKQRMPIKVYIVQGDGVTGFNTSYGKNLREAFNDWTRGSKGRLSWREVSTASEADIVCSWTDDPSSLGESGVEGGSTSIKFWSEGDYLLITAARITLLTHELDSHQSVSDASMKRRCLHEVGHSLGLSGHSPNNQDVMFYTEVASIGLVPSVRDVATLSKLYQSGGRQASARSSDRNSSYSQTRRRDFSRQPPSDGQWPSESRQSTPLDWRDKLRQNLQEDRSFGSFSE